MLRSLSRAMPRLLALFVCAALCLLLAEFAPLVLGPVVAPVVFGVGLTFVGLAVGDAALRILQPDVDAQMFAQEAMQNQSTAAGLVYLGRCLLAGIILVLTVTSSRAGSLPGSAQQYVRALVKEQTVYWPNMYAPSLLASQVEQETCVSPTHRMCWNPKAELRTRREQGVGLGQLTRAFHLDGTTRFDALAEVVAQNPKALNGLTWQNRYDPALQLRALVLKDFGLWMQFADTAQPEQRAAFMFAAYNGGLGGVRSDKKVCAGTKGCNPQVWHANVELTSLKNKTRVPGYGKSFFEINREYVRNVLHVRRAKYLSLDT